MHSVLRRLLFIFSLFIALFAATSLYATPTAPSSTKTSLDVLQQFHQDDEEIAPERAIATQRKHQILFWMGGALLILILSAAGFGIAMGIFDKDVFVWHVLFAGLATTLAIAHGVVAFVWFYPSA